MFTDLVIHQASVSQLVFTLGGIIIFLIELIVLWAIVSIPVWAAAKVVTLNKASFEAAMAATLIGPIIYFLVFIAVSFFLGVFIVGAAVWAYILAFIAWIWNYKSSFDTGWLQAIVIALLADVAFVLLNVLAASVLGIIIPNGFYPRFL